MSTDAGDLTCQELVELVTDYFEDAMAPDDRARFDRHLDMCEGCREHLDQMEVTLKVLRTAPPPEPGEVEGLDDLLGVFRDWKRQRP